MNPTCKQSNDITRLDIRTEKSFEEVPTWMMVLIIPLVFAFTVATIFLIYEVESAPFTWLRVFMEITEGSSLDHTVGGFLVLLLMAITAAPILFAYWIWSKLKKRCKKVQDNRIRKMSSIQMTCPSCDANIDNGWEAWEANV